MHITGAFCASGNSGGAAEIGYALTTWNRGEILDLAVPTSGPAVARLDYACQSPRLEEWKAISDTIIPSGAMNCDPPITLSPQDGVCLQCNDTPSHETLQFDSVVHPDALLHYSNTRLHFIYGANDCNGPSVPIGLTWSTNVTSEKVIEFVPNTSHVIVLSAEGREAIRIAIDKGTAPPTSVGDDENMTNLPVLFELQQNYPNPFNPSTTISFSLPKSEHVTLKVFDVLGREVATIIDNEIISAGNHFRRWEPYNMPSGVFFFQLITSEFFQIRKALLVK